MSTQEQLVLAARELLWEVGYEAMSPRAILERSGAGQGSFYHHFRGKADLAATALNEESAAQRERFNAVLHTDAPPLERVKNFLKQPRDALRGCRLGKMTQEPMITQEPLRDPIFSYFAYLEQELTSALEQARQEGTLSQTINATDMATMLAAVVQGGYVLTRAFQDPQQMEQATRGALALLAEIERR